ncbi:MAG: transposase [Patescibacteria group bacterium]
MLFLHVGRIARMASPTGDFPVESENVEQIIRERFVELTTFCLMPNHFHLLVRATDEGGVARYLQRIEVGYTTYFNTRYQESGHLFQGRYKAVQVRNNRQLLYLSAYIHRNPRELRGWRGKEFEYPWSSLQDYATANRWGGLLSTDIIASQFDTTKNSNYADFVKTSTAKTLKNELGM